MSKPPRIAVLGCGQWGRNHVRTLAGLGALAAVSDRNRDRAAEFAETYQVRALDPEMLFADPAIDAIVIALPPHHQAESAGAAIAAGKHVLVEKPIALSVDDAERIVDAARKAGIVAMTGHILRYHPAFEALQAMVERGELGTLGYIHSHRVGLGRFHPENDALWDIAPHDLSLILALSGSEPISVHGEGTAVLEHLSDFAHLHLAFPGDLRAHVFTARLNPYRERRLTVVGSRAMAVYDDVAPWAQKLAVYEHDIFRDASGWRSETHEPRYVATAEHMPLTRELEHFIACIETGERPRTPIEDGLAVIRILEAGTVRHERSVE
ncbi:Gfo/Idh/MocA family protein [Pararhizobium mangrovi]|uniref:Gfo/Idh/MocA family oxidoreductase n=1 Tax=Pararhizobium mangrovi TaxID=2590452 RepID=A0A506UHK1_9HYPH|nr:Gfo/Idh/MocA family oxidoreductase [Pararhizobium mangrovi]TPW32794.1 Gfo/Idh/MocA family oxidoreductase [Pararhizobium mangrovi]